jgi:riboflavin kinase / FMN adenylyltransferase
VDNSAPRGRLVAVGNFDGVHVGHQAVLAEAARIAAERSLTPLVLTFDPHPASVIGRGAPALLTPLARKIELVQRCEPAVRVAVERFDLAFAAQSPEEFAAEVLAKRLSGRLVIVGHNFRFGRGRAGDFDALAALGQRLGFETRSFALVSNSSGALSSTRAREAIAAGDLDEAGAILGRPHALTGTVILGDQRGRTLGFPTANLDGTPEALPPFGVYAVAVDRLGEDDPVSGAARALALATGVANIGVRPTVKQGAPPTIEVHLFDYEGDLYGARLRVHLIGRLRGEQRFSSLDALRAQIAADAAAARDAVRAVAVPSPGQPWW